MRPDNDEYLGVDVGSAIVGVARGSGGSRIAEPLISVTPKKIIDTLSSLAQKNQAAGIVVGLPRGLDGQETDQTRLVKRWADDVKQEIKLPFYWQDEALTTQAANDYRLTAKSRADEHALAAAIILQDFLDTPANDRVEI